MQTRMIGGPFDGAVGTNGDPGVPSIWPRWREDGSIAYRPYPMSGRPRYDRTEAAVYVFAGALDLSPASSLVAHGGL